MKNWILVRRDSEVNRIEIFCRNKQWQKKPSAKAIKQYRSKENALRAVKFAQGQIEAIQLHTVKADYLFLEIGGIEYRDAQCMAL